MPHFVIEYSRDVEEQVDLSDLLDATYEVGAASGVMKPEDIKVRARAYEHFRMAGPGDNFVHTTIYLLEGRTNEQKEKLSIALRAVQVNLLPAVISISIDVQDMNDAAYKKRLLPSVP